MSETRYHDIASYPAGLVNHSGNLMASEPNGTLWAGENVELTPTLRTRPGYTQMSHTTASGLPAGEIMAMRQVRFPTQETSSIVVQVHNDLIPAEYSDPLVQYYQDAGGAGGPDERREPSQCYDSENNRVWLYGGVTYTPPDIYTYRTDFWYWDVTTKAWTEITGSVNAPAARYLYNAQMVHDPSRNCLWWYGQDDLSGLNKLTKYDIASNTFSDVSFTDPLVLQPTVNRYSAMLYHSGSDSLFCFGHQVGGGNLYWTKDYTKLPLNTLIWSDVSCTREDLDPGEIGSAEGHQVAYDPERDKVVVLVNSYLGADTLVWQLDIATSVWSFLPSPDIVGSHYQECLAYCPANDAYILHGGREVDLPMADSTFLWHQDDAEWTECEVDATDYGLVEAKGYVVGDTMYMVWGCPYDSLTSPWFIPHNRIDGLVEVCNYVPPVEGGGGGEIPAATGLYACPDHLPTTTGVFEQIYDLGTGAGVCSFGVLNDRLVITEGVNEPPLVTGLSLSADASDWLVPKAVLVSQDGVNYYDVGPQVCDKDSDSIANIGNIRSSGALFICCDMPQVEAFYFEMETPNTLSAGEGPSAYVETIDFTASTDLNRQDLKATIDHWVQDSGATGHFENSGNTPLTLGAGNDCPDVEPGLEVILDGPITRYIVAITDDGEGSGEVELSAATTSLDVTGIHGIRVEDDLISVERSYGTTLATTWEATQQDSYVALSGASVRIPLKAADISTSGETVKVTLKAGTNYPYTIYGNLYGNPPYSSYHNAMVLAVTHVSIVERSGSTANGTTTPTELKFSGASGFYTYSFGTTFTSDATVFTVDETKDYLLIIDVAITTVRAVTTGAPTFSSGFLQKYAAESEAPYLFMPASQEAAVTSWNSATAPAGTPQRPAYGVGLWKVEVIASYPQPQTLFVGTTTDTSHLDVGFAENFQGVTVTSSQPGSSVAWFAVSFDSRGSFSVFLSSAWRSIVQHESGTTWQYKDAVDAWQNASTNDMYTALREAFAIAENQMTSTELEAITSAQWQATGGLTVHLTQYLDFAIGLAADSYDCPTLTSFAITVNDYGTTHVYGWQTGAWAAGDGWDDNTVVSDIPWAQSGTVEYLGASPFEADYSVLNEVPGFWFKFVPSGTSSDCAITRILYKAPCQPLSNIGDGQPDVLMGLVYVDTSLNKTVDFGSYSGDYVTTEISQEEIGAMATDDFLYAGYVQPFNAISLLTYYAPNTNTSVLSAEYWNGEAWTAIDITDGTAGSAGKTFSGVGKIEWTIPTDWRSNIPFDGFLSRGYWIRFSVSASLSSGTSLGEMRVYSVPPLPSKHKYVEVASDRVMLACRPDAWDQVDISGALTEYDFVSANSGSYRVGGMDQIQSMIAAWNGLLIGKTESLHLLTEGASGFSFQALEAARLTPINSQVVIKGPASMGNDGSRSSLYWINRHGAFVLSGFSADTAQATGRNLDLSGGRVNWWLDDTTVVPRLYKPGLHKACGALWPLKNWLVWSVPMLVTVGQTEQTTNNRLLIYDLNLGVWYPPYTFALSALCTAYDYSSTAAGKIGPVRLYGGTYDGKVLELLGDTATSDGGTAIAARARTPWMELNGPISETQLRNYWAFGDITGNLTLNIYADGDATTPVETITIDGLDGSASALQILQTFDHLNRQARWWQFEFSWSGPGRLDRFDIAAEDRTKDMPTG